MGGILTLTTQDTQHGEHHDGDEYYFGDDGDMVLLARACCNFFCSFSLHGKGLCFVLPQPKLCAIGGLTAYIVYMLQLTLLQKNDNHRMDGKQPNLYVIVSANDRKFASLTLAILIPISIDIIKMIQIQTEMIRLPRKNSQKWLK